MIAQRLQDPNDLDPAAAAFYRSAMLALDEAGVPFLVGGGYALAQHAGIARCTKDLDLFILPADVDAALAVLSRRGYASELTYPHWLAKARSGDDVIDLIFSSGNGLCQVDAKWFECAKRGELLGLSVLCAPTEEMIWQKAFIMERHRFDGADVMHLLRSGGASLDWRRLVARFGPEWKVLLSHLVMFHFIYPDKQSAEGLRTLDELAARMIAENRARALSNGSAAGLDRDVDGCRQPTCRGTFLSLLEYRQAVDDWGYRDARLAPTGTMTFAEIDNWTNTFER